MNPCQYAKQAMDSERDIIQLDHPGQDSRHFEVVRVASFHQVLGPQTFSTVEPTFLRPLHALHHSWIPTKTPLSWNSRLSKARV